MLRRGLPTVLGVTLLLLVMAAPAQGQLPPPVMNSVSPRVGTQGDTVSLTIKGANFTTGAKVRFLPPTGIQVLSITMLASDHIQAEIKIAPDAPHEIRLVQVVVGEMVAPGTSDEILKKNLVFIVRSRPMLLKVEPPQVAVGSLDVELKIEGKNFVTGPGTHVSFSGTGITTPWGSKVISPTEIRVRVRVSTNAALGPRDITVKNPDVGINPGTAGTSKAMLKIVASRIGGRTIPRRRG